MLYPFIYLRVYYRGFQDSLFPRWPDFLASRGYGGSMATVHRSWLVQGQNFVACTRLLTHLVMGWPACLDRDFTTAGGCWWSLSVFWEVSNLSNVVFFFSTRIWNEDDDDDDDMIDDYWWWLMDLNSAGTQAASFSGRRPWRVMILYQGAFWKSLWSSEGNRTCSCCLGNFLKSMLDPTDSIWFFTDEMLWSNSWWSWVSKTVGG